MGMVLTAYSNSELVKYVDRSNPEVDELCNRLEEFDIPVRSLVQANRDKDKKIAELERTLDAVAGISQKIKRVVGFMKKGQAPLFNTAEVHCGGDAHV